MDGKHSLECCRKVTEETLHVVFDHLYEQRVMLEGMILKPNMVLPGLDCLDQGTVNEVADTTVKCLLRVVPAAVPGIAFLSGGQSGELALRPAECNESSIQGTITLGARVLFCPGDSATRPRDLERPRGQG